MINHYRTLLKGDTAFLVCTLSPSPLFLFFSLLPTLFPVITSRWLYYSMDWLRLCPGCISALSLWLSILESQAETKEEARCSTPSMVLFQWKSRTKQTVIALVFMENPPPLQQTVVKGLSERPSFIHHLWPEGHYFPLSPWQWWKATGSHDCGIRLERWWVGKNLLRLGKKGKKERTVVT